MSITESVRRSLALVLSPEVCIICGEESRTGRPLCSDCENSWLYGRIEGVSLVERIDGRCARCGRPLVSAIDQCVECRGSSRFTAVEAVIPLFPYTAEAQALLTAWKVRGMRSLTVPFAGCLSRVIGREPSTAIVPVPPRPGKVRSKGWDQVDDLCRILDKRHNIRVSRCLERRSLVPQKRLGKAARAENMRSGFRFRPGQPVPETAIVIDDLITTGATLDACAEALKCAGARTVRAITLFYD